MTYWNQVDFKRFAESKSRRDRHHYNPCVAALDTESSTIIHDGKKIAFTYIWQMAIEDTAFYGRTWTEFVHCVETIKDELHLSSEYKLVIYVHNLKYDFAFYKKEVNLEGDFIARSRRSILKHTMQDCFEVRDSAVYTEQPLWQMGEEIGIPKGKGYDYTKVRTFDTPLQQDELYYCANDVLILTKYFRHESELRNESICELPLTATQKVKRGIMREFRNQSRMYQAMIMKRQLYDNPEDKATLKLLKTAFFGGFNYSNILYRGINIKDVTGIDIDTCYGAQCLLHQYPMTKFKSLPLPATSTDLLENPIYKGKAMLITFDVVGLTAKYGDLGFLPLHAKNYWQRGAIDITSVATKRLLKSRKKEQDEEKKVPMTLTLTDIDFRLFVKFYGYDAIRFKSVYGSDYGYMPEYMTKSIIKNYMHKVAVKNRNEQIKMQRDLTLSERLDYTRAKTSVSRIYGILVQDPERPIYGWDAASQDVIKTGNSTSRVQFQPVLYQWGVWVVAWARWEILKILSSVAYKDGDIRDDVVLYSDTDSLYFKSSNHANQVVAKYNESIDKRIKAFCSKYKYDYDLMKDIGKLKTDNYEVFKTLGIKQYAYINHGKFDYRCAGLPRPDYVYDDNGNIVRNDGMTFFDNFDTNDEKLAAFCTELSISPEEAKRKKNIYYDDGLNEPILVTDYLGGQVQLQPKSWVTLEETGFDFDKDPFRSITHVDADRFEYLYKKFL